MSSDIKIDYQFKILSLGDSEVGKTSIFMRYTDDKFDNNGLPTLGVDLIYKYIKIDNKNIRLDLWDTAGEERFRNITKNYYNGAHGIIFVYDLTNYQSFKILKEWIDEVKENVSSDSEMIIAGNKADLEDRRQVTKEMLENFSKQYNLNYFEISAKSGEGINEIFNFLVKQLLTKNKTGVVSSEKGDPYSRNNSVILNPPTPREKNSNSKKCNC